MSERLQLTLFRRLTLLGYGDPNGDVVTFTGEFQGADGRQMGTQVSADGTRSEWEIINIGDTEWMVTGEHVSSEHRTPEQRLSPFAEASSAVVSAVLEGGDVEDGHGERRWRRVHALPDNA